MIGYEPLEVIVTDAITYIRTIPRELRRIYTMDAIGPRQSGLIRRLFDRQMD